jgi:hypothetical protein
LGSSFFLLPGFFTMFIWRAVTRLER